MITISQKVTKSFYILESQVEWLEQEAEKRMLNKSAIVRLALKMYQKAIHPTKKPGKTLLPEHKK